MVSVESLIADRLNAQGNRLDAVETATSDLVKEVVALRTESRLMTDSFKSFRNAFIGGIAAMLGGLVLLIVQGAHP